MIPMFDKPNDQFTFLSYLTNQHKLTQSIITSSLKHLHLASRSSHDTSFAPTHLMFLNLLILPRLPDILKLPKGSVFIFPLNLYQLFRRSHPSHPLQNFIYILFMLMNTKFMSPAWTSSLNSSFMYSTAYHTLLSGYLIDISNLTCLDI